MTKEHMEGKSLFVNRGACEYTIYAYFTLLCEQMTLADVNIEKIPLEVTDNSHDIKQIKESIDDIKKSVESVNQKEKDFKDEMKNLSKEIIEQKQQDLNTEKLAIEKKKQSTQELINKIRKERIDLKLEDLDEETKKNFEKKKTQEEYVLTVYEKDLQSLQSEKEWRFKKQRNAVTSKEEWKEHPLNNAGRIAIGVGAVALAYKWIKRLFGRWKNTSEKKEENNEEKKEKTPRYKKTRFKIAALLWIWGLIIYKWQDILDRIKNFFKEDTEKKRDELFTDIAKQLWSQRNYDKWTNYLKYGEAKYDINELMKKWVIVTDVKTIIDKEKTIKNLQEYIKDPKNIRVNPADTNNIEESQSDEKVKENMSEYNELVVHINAYGQKYQLGDATNKYEKMDNMHIAPGLLIGHMDRTYGNIDAMITNDSFQNIIDGTQSAPRETLAYYPKEIIANILKAINVPLNLINKVINAEGLSDVQTQLSRLAQYFENDKSWIAKQYRDAIIAKQAMIIAYVIDVKETYSGLVDHNPDKLKVFSGNIADLMKKSETDVILKKALEETKMDEDLHEDLEDMNDEKKKILKKIENAKTSAEKDDVVKDFSDTIDDMWFVERSAARDVMIGHVFETNGYTDMKMLEKIYGETFKKRRSGIATLKNKKWNFTPEDTDTFKWIVRDFYDTMHAIKTESHVMQKTDEDGDLYTMRSLPIFFAGKKVYQSFVIRQDDKGMAMWPLAVWTLAAADLLTVVPRKILFSKHTLKGKIFRLSPTLWVLKKTVKRWFILSWWRHLREKLDEYRIRRTHEKISKMWSIGKFYFKKLYKTPSDITDALKKWHISLKQASEIVYDRAGNARFTKLIYKEATQDMYNIFKVADHSPASMDKIKKALLETAYSSRLKAPQIEVLAKYFDHPVLWKKLRDIDSIEKILPALMKWDVDKAIKISTWVIKLTQKEVKKLSWSIIEESQKWFQKALDGINSKYKKLTTEAWSNGVKAKQVMGEYKKNVANLIKNHNANIYKQEKNILKQLKNLTVVERKAVYESNAIIRNIVDANGGMKLLTATKRWRIVKIWLYAVMWTWQWWSALAHGKSWRETTKEVADFWFGMIPVAWDLYDIGMAVRGKDLNGNDMTAGERWVRWWLWLACGVVNVFSFWLWWTAIKGVVKGWIKATTKVVAKNTAKTIFEKTLTKEVLEQWIKQFGKRAALQGAIVIGWLWIIQWADMMIKEAPLDDVAENNIVDTSKDIKIAA